MALDYHGSCWVRVLPATSRRLLEMQSEFELLWMAVTECFLLRQASTRVHRELFTPCDECIS